MNLSVPTTIGDRIVISLAVLLVLACYSIYWQTAAAGTTVAYQTPDEHGTLALDQDQILTLEGADGVSHIQIENGAVRFTASPCHNKHCIHSGWLSQGGDFAACLPNRVTLLVHSDRQPTLDAINY